MQNLGQVPQPTAPWRIYMFRVHCVVTQRWMKVRVPYAYFWHGSEEYGRPEVEGGTLVPPSNPARLPPGTPIPGDAGVEDLEDYVG